MKDLKSYKQDNLESNSVNIRPAIIVAHVEMYHSVEVRSCTTVKIARISLPRKKLQLELRL